MKDESLEERAHIALVNINAQRLCECCRKSYHKETVKVIYQLASDVITEVANIVPNEFWNLSENKEYSLGAIKTQLEKAGKQEEKTQIYYSALKYYKDTILPALKKYQIATIASLLYAMSKHK